MEIILTVFWSTPLEEPSGSLSISNGWVAIYLCSRGAGLGLQEQGRKQLPKPWDKPKEEQCEGFTLDEFARLDLSRMDFSEVYAEFTDAARLPDELETSILIQQKIEDYYARGGQ